MAEMIALEVGLDQDLGVFSRFLWSQGISHRIVRLEDRQLVLVGARADAERVRQYYYHPDAAQELVSSDAAPARAQQAGWLQRALALLYVLPVVCLAVLLSVAGYALVALDADFVWVRQLTFVAIQERGDDVLLYLPRAEYWRLLTPIFLHFSAMHIIFNMLWLWDLGRRIELMQGSLRLLGLIVLIGLGSNIAQYMAVQMSIFGGMSGVIYGLLGYGWIWSRMRPAQSLQIPGPIIAFMLIWLVLCMFGFASLLGVGAVANAAHLGGLLIGMLLGFSAAILARRTDPDKQKRS